MQPNPAWRGDPTFLADVLRYWGVKVQEWPGYKNRGHGDFGAIQGIVAHHTGTNTDIPGYIAQHPDLGLCSQIHLNRDGTAVLVGAGIAWHAGRGSKAGWPTNNANQVSIGIEAASDGYSAWPEAEVIAYRKICAAILWFLGKRATPLTLISHHEYSGHVQGKIDPSTGGRPWDMNKFRAEVNWYIDNPPFAGGSTPATAEKENPMLFTQITDFLKGYLGPQIDALQEVWTQLRGPGGKGWPQLGQDTQGRNLTLVDAVSALRHDVAELRKEIKETR